MTDRMQAALGAGGVLELFPLLATWDDGELKALVTDCEAYYEEARKAINVGFQKAMFTPAVFFSDRAAKAVTDAKEDGETQVLAVTSEICSVAFYYLEERKKERTGGPK